VAFMGMLLKQQAEIAHFAEAVESAVVMGTNRPGPGALASEVSDPSCPGHGAKASKPPCSCPVTDSFQSGLVESSRVAIQVGPSPSRLGCSCCRCCLIM
jgi:hypothetical protein